MSFLNSILGGGNVLNVALSIAGISHPELQVLKALNNMLGGAIGEGIKDAIDQLAKDFGIPTEVADLLKGAVDQALEQNNQPCDKEVTDFVGDRLSHSAHSLRDSVRDGVLYTARKRMSEQGEVAGDQPFAQSAVVRDHRSAQDSIVRDHRSSEGSAVVRDHRSAPGGVTVRDHRSFDVVEWHDRFIASEDKKIGTPPPAKGKSWFVALMMALGEIQNQQAAKIEKLAKEVSEVLGLKGEGSEQARFEKMEEFRAEAKLQEIFANVSKSVGDSLGGALAVAGRST
ncbi:MAG TPA: hypothetical protein VFR86_08090 [Burkholderiaceae bacterium]|nr:hypothetical protein [Burkholderiaceae bacterium]